MSLATSSTLKKIRHHEGLIELSPKQVKQLQDVMLEMLIDLDDFCMRNNIRYTLGGGSCLGAVRHKGFIPWDDDFDINMPRRDYDRFVPLFRKEMSQKYWLHTPQETPGYGLIMPRIRMKGTVVRGHNDMVKDEWGAFIDIFIIENAPNNPVLRSLHGLISLAMGLFQSSRRFAEAKDTYMMVAKGDEEATKTFKRKILLGRLVSFCSLDAWTHGWDRWNALCHNEESEYVTIPSGSKHYFGELYKRSDYLPPVRCEFESAQSWTPNNVDLYLRRLYGDTYMELPPQDKREVHVVLQFDLGSHASN